MYSKTCAATRGTLLCVITVVTVTLMLVGCAQPQPAQAPATQAPTKAPAPTAAPAPTTAPTAAAAGSTELVASNREPRTLDPGTGNDAGTWRFIVNVYEPLVQYKRGTIELEPGLATEWKVSDDSKSYTFSLRKGVTFHDGTPFNAEAVKFTFDRVKKINVGPAYILKNYASADVVDEFTVKINLAQPQATFLTMLPRIMIVSPTAVKQNEKAGDLGQDWFNRNAVGTGPYKFESWTAGQEWVIVKNDKYWRGWPEKHLTKITLKFIPEVATQRLMLERGDLDIASGYNVDDLTALRANKDLNVVMVPSLIELYIPMNTQKGPLKDARVRQAIAYAYDYSAHINQVMGGRAQPVIGPVPSIIPAANKNATKYDYDLKKAKELLTQAGYPNGGFTLNYLYVQTLDEEKRAGEILQAGLSQLGITLNIQPNAWPTILSAYQQEAKDAPDMYGFYIYPAFADPDAYLYQQYHSSQIRVADNGMHYNNPQVDQLLDQARVTLDPAKRTQMYMDVQKLISDDAPALFVSNPMYVLPMRSWVKGYAYTPTFNETYFFYGMYLDGKPKK